MEQQNDKEFLRTEPLGKLLLRLAVPTVAAQLINMLYNIVDRIYIGHIPEIGATALTGVGVCMPLIMIVSAFAALVGYGGAPRASIFMGKKDKDTAEKILGNCFVLQIIISVILTGVLLIIPLIYIMLQIIRSNQTMAVYLAEPIADAIAVTFTAILFAVQRSREQGSVLRFRYESVLGLRGLLSSLFFVYL